MSGIQLTDFVQINSLSKASTALLINADGREGVIYFSDGDIIHATCGDLVGEEAFYELINFKGGTIETFYPNSIPDTTITTPVDALLLQGTLWVDETADTTVLMNEFEQNEQSATEALFEAEHSINKNGTEPASITDDEASPPVSINDEKEKQMEELKRLLSEFTNIPGVNTACLVGRDGFLLNSVTEAGTDTEMVGAIAASGFGASEAMGKQLQKGGMFMTMVEYNNGPIMLSPIGTEAFLVIIADKDANLGMIRLKIKKHSTEIVQVAGI